jgi:hypothetical protein
METRLFLLITIVIFTNASCEKELHELSMAKIPYTGNELRIDGYYYSNQVYNNYNAVAVFYRDGACIHVFTSIEGADTLNYIENNILLNESLISNFMNTPTNIGVFQINTESIEFETWEAGRDIITFSNYGEILNDTTFLITKQINNDSGKSENENLTYRFKQFSPKPDSTNNFIK